MKYYFEIIYFVIEENEFSNSLRNNTFLKKEFNIKIAQVAKVEDCKGPL